MRTVTVDVFEAEYLAMINEVEAMREIIVITRDGAPIWRLEPIEEGLLPEQDNSETEELQFLMGNVFRKTFHRLRWRLEYF